MLINLIRSKDGFFYFTEREKIGKGQYNISTSVAKAFSNRNSDISLQKCLLFFTNLTHHKPPNSLAESSWKIVSSIVYPHLCLISKAFKVSLV